MSSPEYGVARYLAIERAEAPTVTPAGRLLFLADTSGTPQVWTTETAGTWPERLTPHEERVSAVAASPTDEAFVFGMDQGSDKRDQLFHYDLTTGVETALTDEPEAKHAWGAWGPDGDRVAYTANRADPGRFDVYVQEADSTPGTHERVYEGGGGWLTVAAFGPDGRRLALLKPHSSTNVALSVLDLETGTHRVLSGDEPARHSHVHFDGDGGIYCVTDADADTAYVARYDLDTGARTPVAGYEETLGEPETDAWSVDGFAYDAETGRSVFATNENGYNGVHAGVLDGSSFAETVAPDVEGVASGFVFGPNAEWVAFTQTAPTDPYGVHVADWAASDHTEWTPVGTNGLPDDALRTPTEVDYESFDGRRIPAYWTLPEGADAADPAPVIVDIHGGPEHQRQPWFYPEKQFFLNRGYAVLEPNVRGSSGYGKRYAGLDDVENRMDSVADIAAAVEWLSDRPAVDEERVVAYGRSYGGFMVLAAITEYPELWAAAVDFVGIADFTTFLENTGEWRRSHREAEYGSLTDDYEFLKSISPLSNIDRIQCPLFVQHGANDPRVPVGEAEQVADAAREQGVPVETLIFDDEGHHTTSRENRITEFEAIADFLDTHV
ncbi:S9 family peptidase [Salarchaeum japonicum]|uniref:S9 family peptidase n=1 Tax=Salarchaeum japonicum TaxID=555573 RepID=UPI003C76954A